jgi:hypothetical protein
MLNIQLSDKRLKKQLTRARGLRKDGQFHQALSCYTQAMELCGRNEEQRICCLYLMAFTHVLIDHHESQYKALGVDIRYSAHAQLEQAYQCLKLVNIDIFDPKLFGLPPLTKEELTQVYRNHQDHSPIH